MRSREYIRGREYAPGKPTDSQPPCGNNLDPRCPSVARLLFLPPVPAMRTRPNAYLRQPSDKIFKIGLGKRQKVVNCVFHSHFSVQAKARTAQNAQIAPLKRGQVSASR